MNDTYPNTDLCVLCCACCTAVIETVHDGLIAEGFDPEDGDVVCLACAAKHALSGLPLAHDPLYAPAA